MDPNFQKTLESIDLIREQKALVTIQISAVREELYDSKESPSVIKELNKRLTDLEKKEKDLEIDLKVAQDAVQLMLEEPPAENWSVSPRRDDSRVLSAAGRAALARMQAKQALARQKVSERRNKLKWCDEYEKDSSWDVRKSSSWSIKKEHPWETDFYYEKSHRYVEVDEDQHTKQDSKLERDLPWEIEKDELQEQMREYHFHSSGKRPVVPISEDPRLAEVNPPVKIPPTLDSLKEVERKAVLDELRESVFKCVNPLLEPHSKNHLLDLYQAETSGRPNSAVARLIAEYLALYHLESVPETIKPPANSTGVEITSSKLFHKAADHWNV